MFYLKSVIKVTLYLYTEEAVKKIFCSSPVKALVTTAVYKWANLYEAPSGPNKVLGHRPLGKPLENV